MLTKHKVIPRALYEENFKKIPIKKVFEKQNFSKTYQNQLSKLYHSLQERDKEKWLIRTITSIRTLWKPLENRLVRLKSGG